MRPYEFQFSVALVVEVIVSATVFTFSRPKRIKLELSGEYEPLVREIKAADPFDIVKPEDLVDGYPIDESGFWKRMRLRKTFLSVILALAVAIQAILLGYTIATAPSEKNPDAHSAFLSELVTLSLQLAFGIYTLVVSVLSISADDVPVHWARMIHLSILTTSAALLLGITSLIPRIPRHPHTTHLFSFSLPSDHVSSALEYATLALYIISFFVASRTSRGPALHYPPARLYSPKMLASAAPSAENNVTAIVSASVWSFLLFSYSTVVVMLGYTAESLEISDLPILPAEFRAGSLFSRMRIATFRDAAHQRERAQDRHAKKGRKWPWQREGSGWPLMFRLFRINRVAFIVQMGLAASAAVLWYVPAFFLQSLVKYLEDEPERENSEWGWLYCAGLLLSNTAIFLVSGQLWSLSTTTLQVSLKVQLNTILFAKTLLRKDVASSSSSTEKKIGDAPVTAEVSAATSSTVDGTAKQAEAEKKDDAEKDFSSKAQIMTLMTTDVDRVSEFSWHFFALVDAPIEIIIGSLYLYQLLGTSCFFGLAVTCLFLPLNHYASVFVVSAQDNLMKARDERVSLMNEILGGIRMLKFMAWERNFEARVMKIREKELKFQRRNYYIEVFFNAVWAASPVLVTLVSFWHFTVIRKQYLSPSIAFTSLVVFNELKFALNALPETFISMLQGLVSVRRIENYLSTKEVSPIPPLSEIVPDVVIAFNSATVTWPQERLGTESRSLGPSAAPTPKHSFVLHDLTIDFPLGELSLICGKLGSGKTLMLLSLLGEADLLAGNIISPRSPPDAVATFSALPYIPEDAWVVPGICAYVPQTAWLQNASIKDNILFNLPFNEKRYQQTLEACALVSDLKIIEDGDDAEIGEQGVNLSGGQKARVSLARAVYSRASVLLLDDVLSAVDAHTAKHIFEECLKGPLLAGRTIILVSHHVQLCLPGASYVVALDNGKLQYAGSRDGFISADLLTEFESDAQEKALAEQVAPIAAETIDEAPSPDGSEPGESTPESTAIATPSESEVKPVPRKAPRKLMEEERRAVGRISRAIWATYIKACGGYAYWTLFLFALLLGGISPVLENGWLRHWSSAPAAERDPLFYVGIYAAVTTIGIVLQTLRWFILYEGSIKASTVLYKKLLQAVLFANIRFHDTISRGRLLNRFGKDFETLDSSLSDNFGRTVINAISVITTFLTVAWVGGPFFLVAAIVIGYLYFNVAKVYGQTSRDMRRLDSVTRSPLYTIYGESISGVTVLRAYGASTKFLRDMQQHVDTNTTPFYWMWAVNRWLSVRFNLLSGIVVSVTGVIVLLKTDVSASTAGFALAFASSVTNDVLFAVRRFVGLEQSMVALERIDEFTQLPQEPKEFIEPRPPAAWPHEGKIDVENLVIRYAPDLPNVLHNLNFSIEARSKIGVLGRTGGGKSTLALSFFRFVEATEGRILVDGLNIADIGLTDLRSRLTIIPQDPTILSGTLRGTLDVFNEYEDNEIFEALRRVHLIPSEDTPTETTATVNANVFRNLESPISEGGDNLSAGERQLICMARAILKRSKVLLMDEATASVDYATDELISQTIRKEFAESTILTIAHRLRTVIDYDKILLLDQGRIVEFDKPSVLLADSSSRFYGLCKATGKTEFAALKKMAGLEYA